VTSVNSTQNKLSHLLIKLPYLYHFSETVLQQISNHLNLTPLKLTGDVDWMRLDQKFLLELLVSIIILKYVNCVFINLWHAIQVSRNERRSSQLQALNEMPLYPTEDIIWNENIVPTEYFSGEGCLALPKLNLQFLTLHDYLLRNFNLFRLESTCKKLHFFVTSFLFTGN